jgi:hypothetical protein
MVMVVMVVVVVVVVVVVMVVRVCVGRSTDEVRGGGRLLLSTSLLG